MMRSLPLSSWPAALSTAWLQACRPARLRPGGPAANLGPVAQPDYVRQFGYLLQFLQDQGWLDANSQPEHQVTPEVIEPYLERARGSWSSVTLYHNVFKLRRVAEMIDPGSDFA